jgi:ketosteroid isomerase-like protein
MLGAGSAEMTISLNERMAALETRLQNAEDELAIIRLVASYAPLVDSGRDDRAPSLFAHDGVYDVSYGRMTGPDAFSELLRSKEHQDILAQGVAHVMGLPWVRVNGDDAIAINSTQLYLRKDGGYAIFRVAQNVWKLTRTEDGGWKIRERVNRLIGEGDDARSLVENAI